VDHLIRRHWFGWNQSTLVEQLRQLSNELGVFDEAGSPPADLVTINDWALARRAVPCLIGRPSGHPSIEDHNPLFTSELFYLDEEQRLARSFSRWYRLGTQGSASGWNNQYQVKR
jgi:hypothetical protein